MVQVHGHVMDTTAAATNAAMSTVRQYRMQGLCMACCLMLAGCATQGPPSASSATRQDQPAEQAMALLSDGQYKAASTELNRALARKPLDANLHFLNALAYRQTKGELGQTVVDLEETGYRLALEFNPEHWLAAQHLGLLQIEQHQYTAARLSLATAARLRPGNPDIQLALAGAAYQARDLPLALLAAERTLTVRAQDPVALRIAALSSAALGMDGNAGDFASRLQGLQPDESGILTERLASWRRMHAQGDATTQVAQPTAVQAERLAQANPAPYGSAPYGSAPYGSAPYGSAPYGAPANYGSTSNSEPMAAAWNTCVQSAASQYGAYYSGGQSGTSAVDQTPLPALPSPCKGVSLPRMAVVDVALIRTTETTNYNNGINLLDGLKLLLGGAWNQTLVTDPSNGNSNSTTITRSLGLPASGISYSLNIFNAADVAADVIARPTLLALDRMPSNFFSGMVVSVALAGQYGGSVTDKPIGVSLAVTPTFIDEDRLLLAVKGTRSFIEPAQFQGFAQSLTTTSNSVSTNVIMRFGETLILSGLRERESIKAKSGVPVLRDAPLLQNLFATGFDTDFAQHVLIVLTPRKPVTMTQMDEAARRYAGSDEFQQNQEASISHEAIESLRERRPNLEAILAKLQLSRYRVEIRNGDLSSRRFAPQPSLQRTLQDLRQMMHF